MNSLTLTSAFTSARAQPSHAPADPYASQAQTSALLRAGAQYRRERMDAQDMINTDEAAGLAGTTRVTVNAWIKSGRCIGVSHLKRGYKLPRWQFEPSVWQAVAPLGGLFGGDAWRALGFLESPTTALDGLNPRAALEQGVALERVLALAKAEVY
jgi:hypothetical protein